MWFNNSLEMDLMIHLGNKETDKYVVFMREIGFQKSLRSTKMVAYMFFEMKAKVKRKAPCSSSAGDFFLPTRILGSFRLTFAALS